MKPHAEHLEDNRHGETQTGTFLILLEQQKESAHAGGISAQML